VYHESVTVIGPLVAPPGISAHSAVWLIALSIAATPSLAEECAELSHSPSAELVDYLNQRDRSLLKVDRVAYAIRRLGNERFAAAAGTLAHYLDFRVVPRRENPVVIINHLPWHDDYPAMNALVEIGVPATSALTNAIAGDWATTIAVANAVEVLRAIYRDDPEHAVTCLLEASRRTEDAAAVGRLREAATRVAVTCPESARGRCLEALVKPE
jgi:hypothetical protein